MKLQNQTARGVQVGDLLADQLSQYQSGIKTLSFSPNGVSGDTQIVPDGIAGLSRALQSLLVDGSLKIVGGDQALGGQQLTGVLGGLGGGPAFQGVVKTNRLETADGKFRVMFGTPEVGDEVVDLSIYGFDVVATTDVIVSPDTSFDLVGLVTNAKALAAVSGNVIVTFTQVGALTGQAGYTIFAKQAV